MFIAGSHELKKDVVKKKMKNYRKANTELKIERKKDAIQYNDGSIHFYEDEQKSPQEKLQKLNEKQQDLAIKWKERGRHRLANGSPESRRTLFLSRQRVATLGFLMYPRFR